MIKVYIASKIKHAASWRTFREDWRAIGIELHARWFDQVAHEDNATSGDFSIFWLCDVEDVSSSNAVIVYGETGEELRGALVEAGIAIANDILVIVVGSSASFGTWQHHPMVVRAKDMGHAKQMILHRFGG